MKMYLYKDVINSILSFVGEFVRIRQKGEGVLGKLISEYSLFLEVLSWESMKRGEEYHNLFFRYNIDNVNLFARKIYNVPLEFKEIFFIVGRYDKRILYKILSTKFVIINTITNEN